MAPSANSYLSKILKRCFNNFVKIPSTLNLNSSRMLPKTSAGDSILPSPFLNNQTLQCHQPAPPPLLSLQRAIVQALSFSNLLSLFLSYLLNTPLLQPCLALTLCSFSCRSCAFIASTIRPQLSISTLSIRKIY